MNAAKTKSSRGSGARRPRSVSAAALAPLLAAGAFGGLAACSSSATSNAITTPSKATGSKTVSWESFRLASQKVQVELNELNTGSPLTTTSCKNFISVVADLKSLPDSPSASVNTAVDQFAADMKVIADDCVPLANGTASQQQIARAQEAFKAASVDDQKVVTALNQANAPDDVKSIWIG